MHPQPRDEAHDAGGSVGHDAGFAVTWATAASAGRRNMSRTGTMVAEAGCCLWRTAPFFECLWCAQTTRAMSAPAGAQSFFLRRIMHGCVARTLRLPCTCVVMSVSAWPSQQGASHKCEGFHTLQRSSWFNFQSTFPRLPPDPMVANHTNGHQIGVNSWVHVWWYMEMTW